MKLVPVLGNEPFWILKEKELDALAKGALVIDCPLLTLTQRGVGPDSKCYEGSGVLVQNPDGAGFVCRLLLRYPLSFDEVFSQSFVPVGKLLPESHFFDLSAIDWRGRRWSAEYLIVDPSSGEEGTTIVATTPVLEAQEDNHSKVTWNSMSALIFPPKSGR
jgi:hypothetical protein